MDSGTLDTYKQDLLKEFFKIMQNTPHQMQITFRTLHSKFQKKNLSDCNFFDFFLQIQVTFGETIPKRYNTWGLESYFILWAGGGCGLGGWGWLGGGCRAQDPKCHTFLESSHQMQFKSKGKSQKNYNLKDFFFEIYYVKCEK